MAVPNWSPVLPGDHPDHAEAPARHLDRENAALRELVTVYRYLSGLALQDADLAGGVRLISDRTAAAGAVVTPLVERGSRGGPGRVRGEGRRGLAGVRGPPAARPGPPCVAAQPARPPVAQGRRHARH